jgi:predicted CXXCH cytochrome family protein
VTFRPAALALAALAPTLVLANPALGPPRHGAAEVIPELMDAVHAPNPHDGGGKPVCERCHVAGEKHVRGDPVALCAQCHDPASMKHPVGVVQKVAPADLPLAEGARIVCHTCHDPHDVKKRRAGLRLEYSDLCLRCHVRHDGPPKRPSVK